MTPNPETPQGFDFLPCFVDETSPVFSGLFNEVISSSLARYAPPPAQVQEEQPQEDADGAAASTAGTKKSAPTSLEESLLQAMT